MYVRWHFVLVVLSLVSAISAVSQTLSKEFSDERFPKQRLGGTDFIRQFLTTRFNKDTFVDVFQSTPLTFDIEEGKLNKFMKDMLTNEDNTAFWFHKSVKGKYQEQLGHFEQTIKDLKTLRENREGRKFDVVKLDLFKSTDDIDIIMLLRDIFGSLCSFGKTEANDAIIDAACMTTVNMTLTDEKREYVHPFDLLNPKMKMKKEKSMNTSFVDSLRPYVTRKKGSPLGTLLIVKPQLSDCHSHLVLNTEGSSHAIESEVFQGAFCKQKDKPLVVYSPRTLIVGTKSQGPVCFKLDDFGYWYTVHDNQDELSLNSARAVIYDRTPTWNITVFDEKTLLLTSEIEGMSSDDSPKLRVYPTETIRGWSSSVVGVVRPSSAGFYLDAYPADTWSNIPDGSYGSLDSLNFRCQQLPSGVYEPAIVRINGYHANIVFKKGLECKLNIVNLNGVSKLPEPRLEHFLIVFDDANERVATLMSKNPVSNSFLSSADPSESVTDHDPSQLKEQLEKDLRNGVLMKNLFLALAGTSCELESPVDGNALNFVYELKFRSGEDDERILNKGQDEEFKVTSECPLHELTRGPYAFMFEMKYECRTVQIFPKDFVHRWQAVIPSITAPDQSTVVDEKASFVDQHWGELLLTGLTLWPLSTVEELYPDVLWFRDLHPYYFVSFKDVFNLADKWETTSGSPLSSLLGKRTDYWKLFVTTMHNGKKIGIPTVVSDPIIEYLGTNKNVVLEMVRTIEDSGPNHESAEEDSGSNHESAEEDSGSNHESAEEDSGSNHESAEEESRFLRQQIILRDEKLDVISSHKFYQISGGELFYNDNGKLMLIDYYLLYEDGVKAKIEVDEVVQSGVSDFSSLSPHIILVNEHGKVACYQEHGKVETDE